MLNSWDVVINGNGWADEKRDGLVEGATPERRSEGIYTGVIDPHARGENEEQGEGLAGALASKALSMGSTVALHPAREGNRRQQSMG
jgi:hypothetical protein